MGKKIKILAGVIVAISIMMVWGCSEFEVPDNPYDNVDYGDTTTQSYPITPNSIVDIHKRIFEASCAKPGCHDGAFEPDFRTAQSSFATLVYQPVIKNNADSTFEFRVIPFDTAQSVLHERITNCCFVNTNDRMPQDNIGVPLPQSDIDDVAAWIMDGAKDMFGNVPQRPNTEPQVQFYFAAKSDFTETYHGDRYLDVFYNPFLMPNNTDVSIIFALEDDQTPVSNLTVNQLKLSLDKDDLSSAQTINATFISVQGVDYWLTNFNTGPLMTDTTYYMRYYVNDGDHTDDTEFPYDELIDPYKSYYGFRITP